MRSLTKEVDVNAPKTLRESLAEAPFSLAMSSGFFGFFAHTGMLTALLETGLAPVRISGSSAGALVGGLFAAGIGPERLRETLYGLKREDFWDPAPGLGLLSGQRFRRLLEELLPVRAFGEAQRPLSVSVFEPLTGRTLALSEGKLAPAIHASCAVPFMFHPVRIGARYYLDGGIADRPGLSGMPRGERVFYHHIKSRSPWRRKRSSALRIPSRQGLMALSIDGLPRVSPFDLDAGKRALELAYERTQKALETPLVDGKVEI